jgi:condensin complex subunit 1
MDGAVDFDINEALKLYLSDPKTIATPEADSALVECESDPEALTSELVSHILSSIVDAVAESPDAIARGGAFDSLQFLLKCAPTTALPSQQSCRGEPDSELFALSRSASLLPGQALGKILDLVVSGLSGEVDVVHNDFEADDQDAARQHQRLLEMYGFLLQWSIAAVEAKATEPSSDAPVARGRGASKSAKARGGRKESTWDPSSQLQTALECMCKVLKLNLSTIFTTTPDKNTFISLLTRPIYLLLENEQRVKSTSLRMHAFKVLCIAIKHHGHGFGMLSREKAPQTSPLIFDGPFR